MITIIDYGMGNLFSLSSSLMRLNAPFIITSDPEVIKFSEKVILPGVGEASSAMKNITNYGLDEVIKNLKVPVLGICIGMQILCSRSEEGDTECLNIFPSNVKRLCGNGIKVPHMGWNRAFNLKGNLFHDVKEGEWLYFIHSYAPEVCDKSVSYTQYGEIFSSSLQNKNFFGTQFHPEKSGEAGEKIISNFLNIK